MIFSLLKKKPILIYTYKLFFHLKYRLLSGTLFKRVFLFGNTQIEEVFKSISFFGYYNVSPQNSDYKEVFLSLDEEEPRISKNIPAKVILKSSSQLKILHETNSYNWQQGCMLNWLNSNRFIFNDYTKGEEKYISKISDELGNILKIFELPIYAIDKNGEKALCLNFERLAVNRPDYGYFNHKPETLSPLENDGIWLLDLQTGTYELLVSIDHLVKYIPDPNFDVSEHWVNHIEFRPSGEGFVFFHRWKLNNKRFTRLFYYDFVKRELDLLPGFEIVSHYCWLRHDEILVYCKIDEKMGFHLINIKTKEYRFFSENFLKQDGHPSLSPNGEYLVIDSYPGKDRFSNMFLFDLKKDKLILLGKFYQPIRYQKEFRVDLHPKWSSDGKSIYFESGHLGRRQLFKLSSPNFT